MPIIELNSQELNEIVMSLSTEVFRIKQYYSFVVASGHGDMSAYDKKRIERYEKMIEKLEKVSG